MSRLTIEQIKFIDNYLKNSGVEYLDIRYEMTDHVAAALEALEGDFYDNFTEYMLKHKKELLESNKKFARASRNRALKRLVKIIINPYFLLAWGALFGVSYLLAGISGYGAVSDALTTLCGLFLIGLMAARIYVYFSNSGKNWSVADKLLMIMGTLIYFLVVLFKVERLIENHTGLLAYYSFLVCFACSGYICFRQLKNKYKLRYNE